jgi:Uma2 family endonuclease
MVQTPTKPNTNNFLLVLPKNIRLSVTLEQFEELAIANRDLRLERTAPGELIVNPPTGWQTGNRNGRINQQLFNWADRDGTGMAFDSSTGFTLPNNAIRSPDASWVSKERWEALTEEQKTSFPQICPDFVVELRSATDTLKSLQEKMVEYVENGAKLGWLINPQQRQVEVYQPDLEVEVLDNPVELSGGEVLPGFVLEMVRIWS